MAETRAVLFDLDDTLYRERRFVLSGCAEVARVIEASHAIPAARTFAFRRSRFRRVGRDGLLQALCQEMDLPLREVPACVAHIRGHAPRLRLPRETIDTLRGLRADGFRLGILTNGLVSTQRRKVTALGVLPLVDAVTYGHAHAAEGKPDHACFAAALEQLQVPAAATVFLGDHPINDIGGARRAGMRTIWLDRRTWLSSDVRAGAVVTSRAEVRPILIALGDARHATAC